VVAIDGRRNPKMPSGFEVVVAGGTKPAVEGRGGLGEAVPELGAGIILPTSMDGDGTQAGYDLEFTRSVADAVTLRSSPQAGRAS